MKKLIRKGLLIIVFVLVLQLLMGVTTALADPGYYMVRPGDTLFAIGRMYGVNPYTIAAMNGLPNPNYIRIGQVLYVPTGPYYPTYPTPYYPPYYGGFYPWYGYGYGYGYAGYGYGYGYPYGGWGGCWWDP
jgi:hypothetical protein